MEDKEEERDSLYDSTRSSSSLDHHDGCPKEMDKDSSPASQSKSGGLSINQSFYGSEADTAASMRELLQEKEE